MTACCVLFIFIILRYYFFTNVSANSALYFSFANNIKFFYIFSINSFFNQLKASL